MYKGSDYLGLQHITVNPRTLYITQRISRLVQVLNLGSCLATSHAPTTRNGENIECLHCLIHLYVFIGKQKQAMGSLPVRIYVFSNSESKCNRCTRIHLFQLLIHVLNRELTLYRPNMGQIQTVDSLYTQTRLSQFHKLYTCIRIRSILQAA